MFQTKCQEVTIHKDGMGTLPQAWVTAPPGQLPSSAWSSFPQCWWPGLVLHTPPPSAPHSHPALLTACSILGGPTSISLLN